ncbi:unnamed protein product [Cylindrotheca closterium]|uniref:Uncharacterized protein n=1 Tax=Cylindrotheca closterium TaxID=2856 RepID=A0AAD2FXR0_9STRA|nr:unnamed protein product [Cylindrotheca closterium]
MHLYHYTGRKREFISEDVEELCVYHFVQIPNEAYYMFEQLRRVNFHGSALKVIGMRAFYKCINLLEIDVLPSVTTIGDGAFEECWSLTKVCFHENGVLATIGDSAFAGCSSLAEVSIPSSVEIIGAVAFINCRSLARVSFQEGLQIIDERAFTGCFKLEKVDIPRTLEILRSDAFYKCTSLQEVNIEEGNLKEIGKRAFMRCFNLQTINIPSTVERIESCTFSFCTSLGVMKFHHGLQFVGSEAFYSCENLQAVALPKSVEVLQSWAFGECLNLVSVEFEDHPTGLRIEDSAFSECVSLVNISLRSESRSSRSSPDDVHSGGVGINSFSGCTALRKQYGYSWNCAAIPHALVRRFDNFPIHKKCYHASVTTARELALEIESSMPSSEDDPSDVLVDPFGMTPFHTLLSAANCRRDLLKLLLDAYPANVLGWKDMNGKTAIEYLNQRSYLNEDERTMLRMALHRWLVGSLSSWNALESGNVAMSNTVNAIVAEDDVEQRQSLLQKATMALLRYEQMEATTLLELSLWKVEMKIATAALADDALRIAVRKDDRDTFRIRSGASVAIPHVIAFLH